MIKVSHTPIGNEKRKEFCRYFNFTETKDVNYVRSKFSLLTNKICFTSKLVVSTTSFTFYEKVNQMKYPCLALSSITKSSTLG